MSSLITIGVVSEAYGIYSSYEAGQNAKDAQGNVRNITAKQDFYDKQLRELMANPASFFSNPVYTAARDQGLDAVERKMGSKGFMGSGNMATSLMDYAQGYGQQQLLAQEQLLGGLSGATQSIAGAEGAATQAQGEANKEWGDTLASLRFMAGGYKGSSGGGTAGYGTGGGANTGVGWK